MRAAIPTELLLRLMNATPEQFTEVERILGENSESRKLKAEIETTDHGQQTNRVTEDVARSAELRHLTRCPHPQPLSHPMGEGRVGLSPVEAERVTADVARSAFALLQKLEMDAPLKAPSALTVFRLYCVDGYSAEQVARKCRCGKATVIRRLQFIEARTGVKAERFRAMSGHLQQLDDDLNASGAREIYRRGLTTERED